MAHPAITQVLGTEVTEKTTDQLAKSGARAHLSAVPRRVSGRALLASHAHSTCIPVYLVIPASTQVARAWHRQPCAQSAVRAGLGVALIRDDALDGGLGLAHGLHTSTQGDDGGARIILLQIDGDARLLPQPLDDRAP